MRRRRAKFIRTIAGMAVPGIVFEGEDEGAGGGGGGGTQKEAIDQTVIDALVDPEDKPVNLDGKPVVIDGKKYTPAQLKATIQRADEAGTLRQQYEQLVSDLRLTYGENAAQQIDKARESMRRVLVVAGYKGEAIDAELDTVFGEQTTESAEEETTPEASKDTAGGGLDAKTQREIELLRASMREEISERIESAIDQQFERGDLAEIISAIARRDGNDTNAKAAKAHYASEFRARMRQVLADRVDETGKFSRSWIAEAAAKVAPEIVSKARVLTGDPRVVGRTPTPGEDARQQWQNKEPVGRVTWDDSLSPAELEQRRTDRVVDRLSRLALESEDSSAGASAA